MCVLPITAQKLSGVRQVHTNLVEDPSGVREEFHSFLLSVIASWKSRQDQEERVIMDEQ